MKKTKRSKGRRKRAHTPAGHYPKGWDQKRADAIARYYENQSDEQAVAEDEAAYQAEGFAMIQVPLKLVPAVQKLLARRAG
jgi:hypothetical protein